MKDLNTHLDYINSKQTDFYGFDILSERKARDYDLKNLEMNLGDDKLHKKYKSIFAKGDEK